MVGRERFLSTAVFRWCATLACRRLAVRELMPVQIAQDENRALKRSLAPLTSRGLCPGVRSFEALSGDVALTTLVAACWLGISMFPTDS